MMSLVFKKVMNNKFHGKENQPKKKVRITIAKTCKASQTPLAPQKLIRG
jgi:hypothetical protein